MKSRNMIIAAVSALGALLLLAGLWQSPLVFAIKGKDGNGSPAGAEQSVPDAKRKSGRLENMLRGMAPRGVFIVIDTARNRLFLRKGDQVLREAVISSGSGNVLEDPSGKRTWIFDTPRGVFSITSKKTNPVWIKPDWAFIEEGKEIPKNSRDRAEEGMLGDYALGFGNGYFIHGTLYTRLLGRNVTHGCIRVGDDDLEAVFKATPVGATLIIF